jgi:RNA polymerase sigma factor (sigma-70 family)
VNLLVKRARSGDKEAFVQLMEESKLSLLAAARAILKDEEDVADAMQETVLTAFQKLCTLREEKYFKTWLIRILINHCYTILRRRKTVPLSDFLPEESKENNWDDILDVRTALEETSAGDRLVLTLFYVEDMSQREIGRVLGISENAVKQRLARGRSHFKSIYCKEAVNS